MLSGAVMGEMITVNEQIDSPVSVYIVTICRASEHLQEPLFKDRSRYTQSSCFGRLELLCKALWINPVLLIGVCVKWMAILWESFSPISECYCLLPVKQDGLDLPPDLLGQPGMLVGCVVNLTQSGVVREEGTLFKELPPSDWSEDNTVGHFLN